MTRLAGPFQFYLLSCIKFSLRLHLHINLWNTYVTINRRHRTFDTTCISSSFSMKLILHVLLSLQLIIRYRFFCLLCLCIHLCEFPCDSLTNIVLYVACLSLHCSSQYLSLESFCFADWMPSPGASLYQLTKQRIRGRKNKQYSEQNLQSAICAVTSNGLSMYRACKVYGVPKETLRHRISRLKIHSCSSISDLPWSSAHWSTSRHSSSFLLRMHFIFVYNMIIAMQERKYLNPMSRFTGSYHTRRAGLPISTGSSFLFTRIQATC